MKLLCHIHSKAGKKFLSLFASYKNIRNVGFETKEEEDLHKQSLKKYSKASFDYEYLFGLKKSQLVYKVIRMQRQIDSYTVMHSIKNIDGRDKIRVDYPDLDEIIDHYDYSLRRVAFKVAYLGWGYMGYPWSENSDTKIKGHTNVVERVFLEAMLRQQLIKRVDRHIRLDRSGRTDQTVSGLSQVICANVRSNLNEGYGVWQRRRKSEAEFRDDADTSTTVNDSESNLDDIKSFKKDQSDEDKLTALRNYEKFKINDRSRDSEEIPYVSLLNEALPPDIRVLAWSPVSPNFSPRRGCISRSYRYFLPRGNLDVDLMRTASQKYIGKHNFQNFAKLSSDNMENEMLREIKNIDLEVMPLYGNSSVHECDICRITITGSGFLYHQVRFMITVLYAIGMGVEDTSIIDKLFDVDSIKGKPAYMPMRALPLLLYDTEFDDEAIDWRWDQDALMGTADVMGSIWCENMMKSKIAKEIYMGALTNMTQENRESVKKYVLGDLMPDPWKMIEVGIENMDLSKSQAEFREREKKRSIRRLQKRGKYHVANQLKSEEGYENVGWRS